MTLKKKKEKKRGDTFVIKSENKNQQTFSLSKQTIKG